MPRETPLSVITLEAMLKLCRPIDTFQVVTFSSRASQLFESSVAVNEANIAKAVGFTRGLRGRGGTEMLKGVKLAVDAPLDPERLRIIVMLTDGYIGNEAEIIQHVGSRCGDQIRFWAIGIGSSPNMFLIDGVLLCYTFTYISCQNKKVVLEACTLAEIDKF